MTVLLPLFNVLIYPVWHISVALYAAIVTYAILRHKFFDLKVTLTRLLIPVIILLIAIFVYCFTQFKMNLFALASLSLGVACLFLSYLILVYAQQKMHKMWALLNFCLGIWGMGTFFAGVTSDEGNALIAWRVAYFGVLGVSMFFYHMIYLLCGLNKPKMLYFSYGQGILTITLAVATNLFIQKLKFLFNSFYYTTANVVYFLVFILWTIVVVAAFMELFKFIRTSEGEKRTKAQYLFWTMLLGFAGGTTVVIPSFGILLYPYGHFFISIYAAISTYAIFKFQLMNIKVAITRLGILALVYLLVLGIPVGIGFKMLAGVVGLFPSVLWVFLQLSGHPFIFSFNAGQKTSSSRVKANTGRPYKIFHWIKLGEGA